MGFMGRLPIHTRLTLTPTVSLPRRMRLDCGRKTSCCEAITQTAELTWRQTILLIEKTQMISFISSQHLLL